jgi:hypothetical protein
LLLAVRTDDRAQLARCCQQLGAALPEWLEQSLPDQPSQLAFWLNLYAVGRTITCSQPYGYNSKDFQLVSGRFWWS